MAVGVRQYSLNHLPDGISYNPHTQELIVPMLCATQGEVVFVEPNFTPSPENIEGKWTVSPDSIHLQNGNLTKRISDVAGEFAFKHCTFKLIALNQREEIREQGLKSYENKVMIAKLSFLLIMMTLVVTCILASAYYIQLNHL